MRLHRFYIEEYQGIWGEGTVVLSESGFVNQLKNVLRYIPGDRFIGFHKTGEQYEMEIVSIDRKSVVAQFIKKIASGTVESESPLSNVVMYVSLIKKDRFEWLVEKLTELGIKKIIPIVSQRTTTKNISIDRLLKISREAIEQSGQVQLVEIKGTQKLVDALETTVDEIYFLHTSEVDGMKNNSATGVHEVKTVTFCADNKKIKNIFIGPEGGWDENDLEAFRQHGAIPFHLNIPILRTETAAIVAATLCVK